MNIAVIGLGSNIDPQKNIVQAKELIHKNFPIIKASQFVETTPIGYPDQANFLNGAVLVETVLEQTSFQSTLKKIEHALGRKSSSKFGPRSIDLDLLVWNGKIIDLDFYERDFIKQSVLELLPKVKF